MTRPTAMAPDASTSPLDWGPEIRVDGKRPEWLRDGEWRHVRTLACGEWQTADVENPGDSIRDMDEWAWGTITAIRLPADHPHYRQPATPVVDWSRPIEAVHEDGSVIKAYHANAMVAGDQSRWVKAAFDDGSTGHWFNQNGNTNHTRWRIRNVQPTTPERDPALWDRMEALVRDMATRDIYGANYSEARAIVADLPKPVDPDLLVARQIAADEPDGDSEWVSDESIRAGDADGHVAVRIALAAIKRGRELAGEQA